EASGCVAWTRTGQGGVRAERDRLTGRSDPVPFEPSADVAVVTADTGEGRALFVVERGEGEQRRREPAMDLTRELAWLRFDETPAERVGGSEDVEALLDCGAAFTSAEMLGGAARAMEMAVDYAKDRVQFGRPIGSFQAVKHRCADMLVDVEGMRSSAYWAAWCIGAGHEDASVAASTAKIWCSDASKRVMASALQVHGGIGFTWAHDLHLFLKRAQLDQVSFGDAPYHRQRLADLLRPRAQARRAAPPARGGRERRYWTGRPRGGGEADHTPLAGRRGGVRVRAAGGGDRNPPRQQAAHQSSAGPGDAQQLSHRAGRSDPVAAEH